MYHHRYTTKTVLTLLNITTAFDHFFRTMSKSTSALRHSKAFGFSQKVIARSLFAKTNDKQATYDNVYSMSMTDTNDERCKADTNEERCKPLAHVPGPSGIHSIPYFGFFKHFKPLGK